MLSFFTDSLQIIYIRSYSLENKTHYVKFFAENLRSPDHRATLSCNLILQLKNHIISASPLIISATAVWEGFAFWLLYHTCICVMYKFLPAIFTHIHLFCHAEQSVRLPLVSGEITVDLQLTTRKIFHTTLFPFSAIYLS